jgi:hypothetical protein
MTDAEVDDAVARLNEELLRRERDGGGDWQDRDIALVLAALAQRTRKLHALATRVAKLREALEPFILHGYNLHSSDVQLARQVYKETAP